MGPAVHRAEVQSRSLRLPLRHRRVRGAQAGASRHEGGYDDSQGTYFSLLTCLCKNLEKIMGLSAHLMFWYSAQYHDETMRVFREKAPQLMISPYPLVWVKSDNAGISRDAARQPRHVYETCLFGTRGARNIVKIVGDAYSAPTDKTLHPSTKPEPMLRHFMSMLVDENTSLFDPTCGSGAALRAAKSLGANRVFGMDTDRKDRRAGPERASSVPGPPGGQRTRSRWRIDP